MQADRAVGAVQTRRILTVANDKAAVPAESEPMVDPVACAERAGLTYVTDQDPGIVRKPWGRGFTYLAPDGEHIQDGELRERIESLVIPPAWENVWISMDPDAHLQVTGRDVDGRKQYIYHPEWDHIRNAVKFDRTVAFGRVLAELRRRCQKELELKGLSRSKVLSAVVFLLDKTLVRIGNEAYAQRNDSFGLTTLRDRHVDFSGTRCTFEFPGKSGKAHRIELNDPRLARVVRLCRDVPGQELFQYYDEDGERCQIDSSDVNAYLRSITGDSFSAKDFRTWGASVHAAAHLNTLDDPEEPKTAEQQIVAMVKQVSEQLGNTPAVCRSYYIHPYIIEAHREGSFRRVYGEGLKQTRNGYLDRREKALLHFFDVWNVG